MRRVCSTGCSLDSAITTAMRSNPSSSFKLCLSIRSLAQVPSSIIECSIHAHSIRSGVCHTGAVDLAFSGSSAGKNALEHVARASQPLCTVFLLHMQQLAFHVEIDHHVNHEAILQETISA